MQVDEMLQSRNVIDRILIVSKLRALRSYSNAFFSFFILHNDKKKKKKAKVIVFVYHWGERKNLFLVSR